MQFGVFGICDGHGGVAAADAASKLVFYTQFIDLFCCIMNLTLFSMIAEQWEQTLLSVIVAICLKRSLQFG